VVRRGLALAVKEKQSENYDAGLYKQYPPFAAEICTGIRPRGGGHYLFRKAGEQFSESIFSRQMEAIVFINPEIFFAARAILKILAGSYSVT